MTSLKVVMFTQAGCRFCEGAKEYLRQRNIAYTERNISRDQSAFDDLRALGYRSAPIILVNDQAIIGFDVPRLEELLGKPAGTSREGQDGYDRSRPPGG